MQTTVNLPELGENVESVDVTSVLVDVGEVIEVEQPLVEVETEKAAVEVPSTIAGTVVEVHVSTGDTLGPGAVLVTVEAAGEQPADDATRDAVEPPAELEPEAPAAAEPSGVAPTPSPPSDLDVEPETLAPASPRVRRLAREIGVDVAKIEPTGPDGRMTIDDVKAHARAQLSGGGRQAPAGQPELPDFSTWGEISEEPMSTVRRVTAKLMARAWSTVPHVTHHDLADITRLEELRIRYRDRVAEAGGKLTVTAMAVKVAAAALRRFPKLNASLDVRRQVVIHKHFVHMGVAVDTEHGLLVPVIRDADRKTITEIAIELDDLARRARERKLMPDEMQGASFTITNLGGIGGSGFTPIVNWPQVAILGMSRARVESVWTDDGFEPRLMLPLSLSYDHRLVDGADAARFTRWLAEALEHPFLLALEG